MGGGDATFQAIGAENGAELWSYALGRRAMSTPMTYRTKDGRQFVVIASGNGANAVLTAFAL